MERRYSSEISPQESGKEVRVAGWIHDIRNLGGIAFILLRDRGGIAQITAIKGENRELFKEIVKLPRESVIAVDGMVQANEEVRNGYEIIPKSFEIISISKTPLPLGVADKVGADLDTRLDNRFLDLRKLEVQAVFKIRHTVMKAIREQLERERFIEVHTPKIVATATEGGTNLFQLQYFERNAFLNQSPQLFKQILMATGFDRVYEIGPAFRAEEHDTVRHLNEFTSIDIEMAFTDDEGSMGVLERVIHRAVKEMKRSNENELKILKEYYEENEMEWRDIRVPELPFPRLEYSKGLEIAQSNGIDIHWGEDFSMEATKMIAERFSEFYFITKWPTESKPFYAMPFEDAPEICRAFDLNFGEKEITSGAQRVHRAELLIERLKAKGLDPKNFKFYIQAFEYGMPPHAGWGLGAERTTMILTNAQNIRECVLFPRDLKRLIP